MRPALQVRGPLARGVFAAVVLVSLAVLFAPASDVPSAPPGVDKLVHLALFAALAFTGRWSGTGVAALGGGLVSYAVASELIQGFTPLARSVSVMDGLADVGGIVLGLAVWGWLTRRSSGTR